jgi:hypothetical protein
METEAGEQGGRRKEEEERTKNLGQAGESTNLHFIR